MIWEEGRDHVSTAQNLKLFRWCFDLPSSAGHLQVHGLICIITSKMDPFVLLCTRLAAQVI